MTLELFAAFFYVMVGMGCWLGMKMVGTDKKMDDRNYLIFIAIIWPLLLGYAIILGINFYDKHEPKDNENEEG